MKKLFRVAVIALALHLATEPDTSVAAPSHDLGPFVSAGQLIQQFDTQTGALVGNVSTNWNGGTSNAELQFGFDRNLYGLGSNGWVFKFDFASSQTSIFAKPTGNGGANGLAQGANGNWYVTAGTHLQEFSPAGSLIRTVTTQWDGGAENAELHFGPDQAIYGLGSNGWIFRYDFTTNQRTTFAKPTGNMGTTGLALGVDSNWYVAAGNYIQKFSPTGTLLGNVTTSWIGGTSNTELHFGPDGHLYGLGTNSWVYRYDFATNLTTVFAKPIVHSGPNGLAFRVPEPSGFLSLSLGTLLGSCLLIRPPRQVSEVLLPAI